MNTEKDDQEQMEFLKKWRQEKEEKKRVREIRAELRRKRIYKIIHGGKKHPDEKGSTEGIKKRD